jgi:regulator of replication initiation timing
LVSYTDGGEDISFNKNGTFANIIVSSLNNVNFIRCNLDPIEGLKTDAKVKHIVFDHVPRTTWTYNEYTIDDLGSFVTKGMADKRYQLQGQATISGEGTVEMGDFFRGDVLKTDKALLTINANVTGVLGLLGSLSVNEILISNTTLSYIHDVCGNIQSQLNKITTNSNAVFGNVAALQTNSSAVFGNVAALQTYSSAVFGNVAILQTNVNTVFGNVETLRLNVNTLQTNSNAVFGNVAILQTNVNTVFGNVETLRLNVNTLQTNSNAVFGNVATLQTNVNTVFGNVETLRLNVNTLQTNSNAVFGNVAALQTYSSAVFGNVAALQTNSSAVFGNVAALQTYSSAVFGNVATLQTNVNTVFGNVATLQTNVNTVFGNVATLQTNVNAVFGNVATLRTNSDAVFGNVATLQTYSNAVFGNVGSIQGGATFTNTTMRLTSKDLILSTTSEIFGNLTATSVLGGQNGFTIPYTGSNYYSSATGAGPYKYNFTGVNDLVNNSHIFTVITKSVASNTNTCYGNSVLVNGSAYRLFWSSGEDPGTGTMMSVALGDIVTQQFALLPSDFSGNVAISNISYYRSV